MWRPIAAAVASNASSLGSVAAKRRATDLPTPAATAQRCSLHSGSKISFIAALVGVVSASWLISVSPNVAIAAGMANFRGRCVDQGVATRPIDARMPKAKM